MMVSTGSGIIMECCCLQCSSCFSKLYESFNHRVCCRARMSHATVCCDGVTSHGHHYGAKVTWQHPLFEGIACDIGVCWRHARGKLSPNGLLPVAGNPAWKWVIEHSSPKVSSPVCWVLCSVNLFWEVCGNLPKCAYCVEGMIHLTHMPCAWLDQRKKNNAHLHPEWSLAIKEDSTYLWSEAHRIELFEGYCWTALASEQVGCGPCTNSLVLVSLRRLARKQALYSLALSWMEGSNHI